MSSPAKKRKKNGFKGSSTPVKSLDYFFAKQKGNSSEVPTKQPAKATGAESNGADDGVSKALTDEELARKLQAQWDKERRTISGDSSAEEPKSSGATAVDDAQQALLEDSTDGQPPPVSSPSIKSPKPALGKNTLTLQSTATDEDTISVSIPFDESPLVFDPSKYIPHLQKAWASDSGHATYALLTRCFVLVNSTQSRIKIVDTLVNLLRTLIEGDPDSLLPAVWLATNSISPPYIDLELGLGGSAISKALKKTCGLDNAGLRTLYNKYGDAGDVAFEAKKRQSFTLRKPKPLTIKGVFDSLAKIANSKGQGSVEAKQRIVERLVQDARGAEESRYIVRTLVQHLRIGAVKTTMLIALSRAFLISKPPGANFPLRSQDDLRKLKKDQLAELYSKNEEIVKACFARHPNYNDLVPTLLEVGVCEELLLRCGLGLHIPLRPMLGSITRDMGEMLTKLQGRDFSCEFKYDGQRAQVHCAENGKVSIFSRHLELMTDKYPDLVALVPKIRGEGVGSFIMEGEVVAVDQETGELKPFQTLANRARKDVAIGSVKIDVCLFAFDLMYLNGEELLDRPFRERRSLLRSLFVEIPHHFTWVKSLDATSADADAVSAFFKQATDIKCEGIMVKVLDNLPNPELEDQIDEAERTGDSAPPPSATPKKSKGKSVKAKAKPSTTEDGTNSTDTKASTRRKPLLATYEPDKRLDSWLKVKKDYHSTSDTLDLVPIGGWHGQGRKHAWWSPVLLAVRNPDTGGLEAVTKCMSGFSDKFYKDIRAKYDPDWVDPEASSTTEKRDGNSEEGDEEDSGDEPVATGKNTRTTAPPYLLYSGPEPTVWFEPQEVWECVFADVTLSPTYSAALGLVSQERGLSLRFPRFLRVREDKGIEEASTNGFLAELYWKQIERGGANGKEKVEERGDEEGDE